MSKHKRSVERHCIYCGKRFMTYPKGAETAKYCSKSCASLNRDPEIDKRAAEKRRKPMVKKNCPQCGRIYFLKPMGQLSDRQKFCSKRCSALFRFRDPKVALMFVQRMWRVGNGQKGTKRPEVAERMRRKNPMFIPEVRERARQAKIGRTFLSRGGNGKFTPQQATLC